MARKFYTYIVVEAEDEMLAPQVVTQTLLQSGDLLVEGGVPASRRMCHSESVYGRARQSVPLLRPVDDGCNLG